ncbi:MAG TPA: DNA alkylation repair protein [Polyangiaceae bacterium]|nr:DNA alkylation repair protein [Polyangiaceae bacterium]
MPATKKSVTKKKGVRAKASPARAVPVDAEGVVATLKRMGSQRTRDGMARYAIPSDQAFGVPVGELRAFAKRLGPSHALAAALWDSGWYEARMLACFVDEPALVTSAQMDRWCRDFDNWAICDTACFHLFDRTPHAFGRIAAWSRRRPEFVRRGAFALLASVALHDKESGDEPFLRTLPLIEAAASDERNFVKKSVSWALRGIGGRSRELSLAALALGERLSASDEPTQRWVGKDVLRELRKPALQKRLAARSRAASSRAKAKPRA